MGVSEKVDSSLLEIKSLKKYFLLHRGLLAADRGTVRAVDGIDLRVFRGETLGIVGESGCGKTTMGRLILRLEEPTGGEILFEGKSILAYKGPDLKQFRRDVQIIFQDPYSSLNPRRCAGSIIGEPFLIHKTTDRCEREDKVARLMEIVGLTREQMSRYPHEFSGGQRQRIGVARALALNPKLVIADEPVSALDVSVQAQILNLLKDLQQEFGLTYIFISHDLSVVEYMSDRVAVMYLGKIVELAESRVLYNNPLHPYTKVLLSAIPTLDPGARSIRIVPGGDVPNPLDPPPGCSFHPRCPFRMDVCDKLLPVLKGESEGHSVACHLY